MDYRFIVTFLLILSLLGCASAGKEIKVEPIVESKRVEEKKKLDEVTIESEEIDSIESESVEEIKVKDLVDQSPANVELEEVSEAAEKVENSSIIQNEVEVTEQGTVSILKEEKKVTPMTEPLKRNYIDDQYNPNFQTVKRLLPPENSEERTEAVTHALIHFSSYAGRDQENPYEVNDIYNTFKEYGVSAHYLIDRKGTIYELVPESRVAYHAGKGNLVKYPTYRNKLNHYSIGIEIMAIGTEEEMLPMMSADTYKKLKEEHIGYTEAQYESVELIIDDLVKRYPNMQRTREHIIGHDEYARGRKTDPGSLFDWSKLGF